MLVFRFLLFIAVISNWIPETTEAFNSSATYTFHYQGAEIAFQGKSSPFINVTNAKIESFSPPCYCAEPNVIYVSNKDKNAFSFVNRFKAHLGYLTYSETIGLKLDSFLITYPFHSFP